MGLCEVHYNKRGLIRAKSSVKKRVDPSSHAAQLPGQTTMFSVPKR